MTGCMLLGQGTKGDDIMADGELYVRGIRTATGDKAIDYNYLANKPKPVKEDDEVIDEAVLAQRLKVVFS